MFQKFIESLDQVQSRPAFLDDSSDHSILENLSPLRNIDGPQGLSPAKLKNYLK
jgi:hypothetical protein